MVVVFMVVVVVVGQRSIYVRVCVWIRAMQRCRKSL
jgi:hypothetical protein